MFSSFTSHLPSPARAVGVLGLVAGALLLPPLFGRLLAEPGLEPGGWQWGLAGVVLGLSAALVWRGKHARRAAVWCMAAALLPLNAELAVRAWSVHRTSSEEQFVLKGFGMQDYAGHPLLHYVNTATQGRAPQGGARGSGAPYHKPADVVRVACVGGSTTADGYPDQLQRYLDRQTQGSPTRFEVLNFGVSGWTTAHTLVNFTLNIVEYRPDYVVIQHAANDLQVRGTDAELRGDYSHALKTFAAPSLLVRGAMRHSLLVRLLTLNLPARLAGNNLYGYSFKWRWNVPPRGGPNLYRLFQRNIDTMVLLALWRGVTPVLTTQPYRLTHSERHRDFVDHMVRCNDRVRSLARQYGPRVQFVDLDRKVSGTLDHLFIDTLHLGPEGCTREAALIGGRILAHHRARAPR